MRRHVEIVCTGNICRSPIGEVVLRAKLAEAGLDDVVVTSSGTGGWHVGNPMDSGHLAALQRHTPAIPVELFAELDVPDPYYGEDAGFDQVLDQIEKAADRWVEELRAG